MAIKTHTDARGILKKIFTLTQMKAKIEEVYLLNTLTGAVRGNHYHKMTEEYFAVVQGWVEVVLQDVASGEDKVLRLSAADDAVLRVGPGIAHAFINRSPAPCTILAISTREYLAHDPDTYKTIIV